MSSIVGLVAGATRCVGSLKASCSREDLVLLLGSVTAIVVGCSNGTGTTPPTSEPTTRPSSSLTASGTSTTPEPIAPNAVTPNAVTPNAAASSLATPNPVAPSSGAAHVAPPSASSEALPTATTEQTSTNVSAGPATGTGAIGEESPGAVELTSAGDTETSESSGSAFPDGVTKPKLMIVGDSISAGPGCYKKFLDEKLKGDGITSYEFVGKYSDDCGGGIMHSAVSCSTTSDYVKGTFVLGNTSCSRDTFDGMAKLMAAYEPDLVMLQLGVNDVWDAGAQIQPVLVNYAALVEQARTQNPNVVIVVAQIQKINTQQAGMPCMAADFSPKAKELVDAIPAWVASVNTGASPVFVADLWTNSLVSETKDCVHPTDDTGATRMADNWFAALQPLLKRL